MAGAAGDQMGRRYVFKAVTGGGWRRGGGGRGGGGGEGRGRRGEVMVLRDTHLMFAGNCYFTTRSSVMLTEVVQSATEMVMECGLELSRDQRSTAR